MEMIAPLATVETYIQKAKLLQTENNLPEAIAVYQEAIKLHPKNLSLYDKLGKLLVKSQAFNDATQCYKQAISLNFKWFKPYFALGEIAAKQDQVDLAIGYYEQAISLNPKFVWAYFYLGQLAEQQGQLEQARAIYEVMLEIKPDFFQGYRQIGLTYVQQEAWEDAIKYLLKALYIKPDCIAALHDIDKIIAQSNKSRNKSIFDRSKTIPLDFIKKYMPSIKEWSVVNKSCAMENVEYIDIYPRRQACLVPPKSIEQELRKPFSATEVYFEPKYLTLINNGLAWADKWRSAVMTQNHQLLAHVSTGYVKPIVASDNLPAVDLVAGQVAFLSSRWGSKAYFHWMLQVLPRIELLRQGGIDFQDIDKFCFYECDAKFNQETLNILGISREKIIDSKDCQYIQASKLLVPSIVPGAAGYSDWVIDFLRREFLLKQTIKSENCQRIYIKRKAKRVIVNEAEVEDLLANYGFKTISLESMSVVEQASVLAAAEIVIAPHGAGLTNLVFCRPQTKIIEIFSPKYLNPCYWYLSSSCDLDYYYLIGENLYDPAKHNGAQDILVNINSLSGILKLYGIV